MNIDSGLLISWLIMGPIVIAVMVFDEKPAHAFLYGLVWLTLISSLISDLK